VMIDLAQEFYEKGTPAPHEIHTEIVKGDWVLWQWKQKVV
jgi:hypothetical protein